MKNILSEVIDFKKYFSTFSTFKKLKWKLIIMNYYELLMKFCTEKFLHVQFLHYTLYLLATAGQLLTQRFIAIQSCDGRRVTY